MIGGKALRVALARRAGSNDVKSYNFAAYRKPSSDSQSIEDEQSIRSSQQMVSYLAPAVLTASVTTAVASYGAKYIMYMNAAKDVLAMASTEIELDSIPEGANVTMKWRGKPLFVRHRTQEQIDDMATVDVGSLRDQQADSERAKNPKFLICLGVCTHLGCVPLADAGNYAGGYFCPCHGSHYDAAGRIRMGPAPMNLELPPVQYLDDTTVKVG